MIIDTDWDSLVWAATDRDRAARIAAAWNEHLPDPYLPRSLAPRLRAAGFACVCFGRLRRFAIDAGPVSRGDF